MMVSHATNNGVKEPGRAHKRSASTRTNRLAQGSDALASPACNHRSEGFAFVDRLSNKGLL